MKLFRAMCCVTLAVKRLCCVPNDGSTIDRPTDDTVKPARKFGGRNCTVEEGQWHDTGTNQTSVPSRVNGTRAASTTDAACDITTALGVMSSTMTWP